MEEALQLQERVGGRGTRCGTRTRKLWGLCGRLLHTKNRHIVGCAGTAAVHPASPLLRGVAVRERREPLPACRRGSNNVTARRAGQLCNNNMHSLWSGVLAATHLWHGIEPACWARLCAGAAVGENEKRERVRKTSSWRGVST